jgi:hypothetical protein
MYGNLIHPDKRKGPAPKVELRTHSFDPIMGFVLDASNSNGVCYAHR